LLFRLRGLVALDVADHVVPPLLGLTAALIADLVQDVVEVADGIEDLPDVRLLNPRDGGYPKGMRFDAASGSVRVVVDALTQPTKRLGIVPSEVELQAAVSRNAGTGAAE